MEVCFDNREADIGRFIRRHLSSPGSLEHLQSLTLGFQPPKSTEDLLIEYIEESERRYSTVINERHLSSLPPHGIFEVGLIFQGSAPQHSANQDFLNLLAASNPSYTGWPIWLDSRKFAPSDQPYHNEGEWEALIVNLNSPWFQGIDFMRLDPKGRFFQRRALEEDLDVRGILKSQLSLDLEWVIRRTAEALAVGQAFAVAMGYSIETSTLGFAFRWSGLKNRSLLTLWHRIQGIPSDNLAYQDNVTALVSLPLDTPLSALANYVEQAVRPVIEVFNGYSPEVQIFEEITQRLIERR